MHNSESLRRAFGYLFPGEIELLKQLVSFVPHSPCVIVNIGAGAGTSGLAFLESREDIELHTVDITNLSSPHGCLEAERDVGQAAGYSLGDRWRQYHMDSKQLAVVWKQPVDVCFVDGDHSYAGAVGDIVGWLPHIRTGGFIAVHDYRKGDIPTGPNGLHEDGPHPMVWGGVDHAVDDYLKSQFPVFAHVKSLIVFKVE